MERCSFNCRFPTNLKEKLAHILTHVDHNLAPFARDIHGFQMLNRSASLILQAALDKKCGVSENVAPV